MLKVTRTKKPDSLDKNADQWTKELLYEINKQGGKYSKVEDKYKNRYKKADVLNALRKMYKSRCCYCESIFSATSFENIEHLKPKSNPSFYHLTFDWDNLHYCCTVCNINKKAKWDFTNPILDPTKDDVERLLIFNDATAEFEALSGNPRAKTTINHTDMNRFALVKARKDIIGDAIYFYKGLDNVDRKKEYINYLKQIKNERPYLTVYNTLIEYFQNDINGSA